MSAPNPYAAPRAPVADASGPARNFLPSGRAVPASHGWDWIADGWDLFKRQPVTWIVFSIVGVLVLAAFHFLMPILGQLVLTLLAPVFAGGIMIGCRDLEEGRTLRFSHLFAGFRERFGSLISVGLISLAFTVLVALVVGLIVGVGMGRLLGSSTDPAAMAAAGLTLPLAFLVVLALLLPVYMAMWFAPPLVVFHEQGPGEAMKGSFVACLKNIVPFLLYSVILFLLSIAASLPMLLGWLVLMPVVAGSLYAGYRDIFFD